MAKSKKELPNSNQENLGFEMGEMNTSREISNAVSASMKRCPLSRYHIAARISELVNREITKTMLDHYAGESHDGHVIPADLVKAFCYVIGSNELNKVMLQDDATLATGKDARYLELAKAQVRRDNLDKKIEELKSEISK